MNVLTAFLIFDPIIVHLKVLTATRSESNIATELFNDRSHHQEFLSHSEEVVNPENSDRRRHSTFCSNTLRGNTRAAIWESTPSCGSWL